MSKPRMSLFRRRKFWQPRREELPQQCAACPFKKNNELEFGEIVRRLFNLQGAGRKPTPANVRDVRLNVKLDKARKGDFICHDTVYDDHMRLKPEEGHRQCPGASKWYRTGK